MNKLFEIKIVGRGGQGGKTASEVLATVALDKGKFIQSFPEYGAERKGAPVKAYVRISDKEIRLHTGVTNPNVTVVIDETLLSAMNVTEGMDKDGKLIINTGRTAEQIKASKDLNGFEGTIYILDATKIALEVLGSPHTNTAMLGAIEKVTNFFTMDALKEEVRSIFIRKLGESGVEKNIAAIERAYSEVKQC